MAFVALDLEDASLVGVSRLAADPDNVAAEFAILVRSDRQGCGIGRALMQTLIEYAEDTGIGTLLGEVLSENRRMLKFCADLGFSGSLVPDDATTRTVELRLTGASHRAEADA